jgi:CubicO group peptidase (beta-lactamase class C family)
MKTRIISKTKLTMLGLNGMIAFVLLFSLLASPRSVSARQTPAGEIDFQALDAFIEGQMAKHGIKGISLAVTSGTEIAYLKGYGTAGNGRPMTPETPMYIGSQSKSFTGLAIAQLVEQGKIRLNDPVQKYLPWFEVADQEASQRITVNHLLYHTSGLSESGFTAVIPEKASKEEAVRALASAKLTAPLGTKHQYFNYGYIVLTLIIEEVSGQTYEDYVQENIFDPLDMASTYTDPALAREKGLSQGYSRLFGFVLPQKQPHRSYEVGEGFIISTAENLAHYAIAMDNAGIYKGQKLLSLGGMDMLFKSVQGYGMGWFVEKGHVFHGGANETFKTYVDIYPLRDQSIVLLINQGYMFDHYISAPQLFKGVEAIVLGRTPPAVSEGWSVRYLGWGLLVFVLALSIFQLHNVLSLRGWIDRSRTWSPAKKAWDVASNFLIPTVILVVVFSLIKNFFGYRFNLTYQIIHMYSMLTDITILMLIGSVPDFVQGFTKLYWLASGKSYEETPSCNTGTILIDSIQ